MWPESSTPFMFEEESGGGGDAAARARTGARAVPRQRPDRAGGPRVTTTARSSSSRRHGRRRSTARSISCRSASTCRSSRSAVLRRPAGRGSVGGFTPGTTLTMLPVERPHASAPAICYEVGLSRAVAEAVQRGSELLTTITNDAWFGRSRRRISTSRWRGCGRSRPGRYLARAANTGISAIVDPYGRVVQATPLFEETVSVGEVALPATGRRSTSRIGTRPLGRLVVAIGLWVLSARGRRRSHPPRRPRQEIRVPPSIVKNSSAATKTS